MTNNKKFTNSQKPVVKTLAWLFILITFFFSLISLFKIITTFAPDFSVFYASASNAVHGVSVYTGSLIFTGFGYPIVTAIPYIPFLLFPYQISQGLFIILSFLAIPLIVFISLKIINAKYSLLIILLTSAFIFLSFPTKFTLGMGQSNLLVYALLLFSFYLLGKSGKYGEVGGIAFGLCLIIKPVLAFLILYFLLYRKWRFLLYAFFTVAFGFLCSLVFFNQGLSDYYYYFHTFLPHILGQSGREIYYNQGISGFVSRLIPNLFFRTITTLLLDLLLVTSLIGLILMKKVKPVAGFALFLAALPLVDSLSWQHHFVFLIFPFIYLVSSVIGNNPKPTNVVIARILRRSNLSNMGGLLHQFPNWFAMTIKSNYMLLLIGLSYLLISMNIKDPTPFYQFPLSLLLSHVFYGSVLLFLLIIRSLKKNLL